MSVLNKPVTSREYKLILKPNQFEDRAEVSAQFFQFIAPLIKEAGGKLEGEPEEKERWVCYLDTPDFQLNQKKITLRLREEMEAAKRFNLTLKHRNSDRYLSVSTNVAPGARVDEAETKFEEDILRGSVNKFAHSTSVRFANKPKLDTLADVLDIFPGLASLGVAAYTPITKFDFVH